MSKLLIALLMLAALFVAVKAQEPLRLVSPKEYVQVDISSPKGISLLEKVRSVSDKKNDFQRMGIDNALPGVIIMDDEPRLLSYGKQIVFLTTRQTGANTVIIQETRYGNGETRIEGIAEFPQGLSSGSGFVLHNGEFSSFTPRGLATFRIFVIEAESVFQVESKSPIYAEEDYSYFKAISIDELVAGNGRFVTVKGRFFQNQPITVVINWNVVKIPGLEVNRDSLRFVTPHFPSFYIPRGKYRMTICQLRQCSSVVGFHQ